MNCACLRRTSYPGLALFGVLFLVLSDWVVPRLTAAPADTPRHSQLWDSTGESWDASGRLPDFSFAGYQRGERPLPQRSSEMDVKSFGAAGDGHADDTEAFQKAIAAAKGKVLAIPAGRYKITDFLILRDRGTVMQGAGPEQSVLVFPIPLNEIKPDWGATTTGQRTSNYSWSGGFVHVTGRLSREQLATVTAPARRGDRSLVVSNCEAFRAGDDVRLVMRDTPANTLAAHLYAGDPGPVDNLQGRSRESFNCRLTRVETMAKRIHFDRPLRVDVRLEWKPALFPAKSTVEEVGIEGLGFEFPAGAYGGHFTEVGFNAIAMSGVRNCWARHLRVHNADSGIFISGVNITLQNILLTSERAVETQRRATGHHGITLGGQDNLLTHFDIRTRFMHDITVTSRSAGNVIADGKGLDLALDHHCYGPHANLFTSLDLGLGSRMFQSGGGAKLGRHSAAYETFWSIKSQQPQTWPKGWGPDLMNLVGVESADESITKIDGKWFEVIPPDQLQPCNLYRAQLARRLSSE